MRKVKQKEIYFHVYESHIEGHFYNYNSYHDGTREE